MDAHFDLDFPRYLRELLGERSPSPHSFTSDLSDDPHEPEKAYHTTSEGQAGNMKRSFDQRDGSQAEATLGRFSGPVIALLAGSERKAFSVHQNLIKKTSIYARSFLDNKDWVQQISRATSETEGLMPGSPYLNFSDHDVEAVDLYVTFLYSQKIDTRTPRKSGRDDPEWSILLRAYRFGDYIQDEPFANAIIDRLTAKVSSPGFEPGWLPSCDHIYTTDGAIKRLSHWFVDCHIYIGRGRYITAKDSHGMDPPNEFLLEAMAKIVAEKGFPLSCTTTPPWKTNPCIYHSHSTSSADYCVELARADMHKKNAVPPPKSLKTWHDLMQRDPFA